MTEMRIFGPPGTGKTTKLTTEVIPALADKYGSDKIMITSFTRAAAEELASRLDQAESDIIGTLHSICYRALRFPELTEQHIEEWNKKYSHYRIPKSGSEKDNVGIVRMAEYQVLRNKLVPRENWPGQVENFAREWEAWKSNKNYMDFMDLIETAGGLFSPPGSPAAIVIDEAQDFSRLEMSVLRRWGSQIREFWVAGDEDQTCFSFTGASPKNMLEPPLPTEQKFILDQSYRIPSSVHELAEKIIHRVTVREEKIYKPRPEEGSVNKVGQSIKDVNWIINKIKELPGTSMILTSCNYMLNEIIAELRKQGMPFSNPWKPEDKTWNPLSNKTAQFFINFLEHGDDDKYWTTEQFLSWAQHIKVGETGLIRKQGRAGINQLIKILDDDPDTPGLHTCREYIDQILSPDAVKAAMDRDLSWLLNNVTMDKKKPLRYPMEVCNEHGIAAIKEKPKIHPGTIHSVKGAGSDNVFISPDLSWAGQQEAQTKEGYENMCRLFYVGVTRTKQNLFLLSPSCQGSFNFF